MTVDFLDRKDERAFLTDNLPPKTTQPGVTIIRAPSGFGKTTLTDWLVDHLGSKSIPVIIADPQVRASISDHQTYQGYFIQKSILAMEKAGLHRTQNFPSFATFLQKRGWRNLKGYNPSSAFKKIPNLNTLYSLGKDILERLWVRGNYAPETLLESDNAVVIELCAEYFRTVFEARTCVLIIRETQHCDVTSLEEILRTQKQSKNLFVVMEYTTKNQSMKVEHQKVFEATFGDDDRVHIINLARLPWDEVCVLLDRHAGGNKTIVGEFQANWDGNLRTVKELRYQVAIGQNTLASELNLPAPTNITASLHRAIQSLNRTSRLILALLAEHVEPMSLGTLTTVMGKLPLSVGSSTKIQRSVEELKTAERFIDNFGQELGLANDDVSRAVLTMPDHATYQVMASQHLLDFYAEILENRTFVGSSLVLASRHAIRLASRRNDLPRLIGLLAILDNEIQNAADPAIYVSAIMDSALKTPDIGPLEKDRLIDWAVGVTYRSSDFTKTVEILRQKDSTSISSEIILAHSLIETGEETEARQIALQMRNENRFSDADIMCDLIIGNLDLVHMEDDACLQRLRITAQNATRRDSVLTGHAYRLLESAVDEEQAIEYCQKSIEAFEACKIPVSAAYSKLAITRHLARLGRSGEAMSYLDEAEPELGGIVASRQFLLNNRASVLMLQNHPDFKLAFQILRKALTLSRDGYSDITILQNLVIAAWQSGRDDFAQDTASQLERLIKMKSSTTSLLCVPVAFTLTAFFDAKGNEELANRARSIPQSVFGMQKTQHPYWGWRLGYNDQRPDCYPAMILNKPFHPLFLSQWHVDQEVVTALTEPSDQ